MWDYCNGRGWCDGINRGGFKVKKKGGICKGFDWKAVVGS